MRGRGLAAGVLAALALPATAGAATRTVSADRAVARGCHLRYAGAHAPGTDVTRVRARADGAITVTLEGSGDWDVGVFDARTRRYVAGSAGSRTRERAESLVRAGRAAARPGVPLRRHGAPRAPDRHLHAGRGRPDGHACGSPACARRPRMRARACAGSGSTSRTAPGATAAEVVLHGDADARRLEAAGLDSTLSVPDVAAADAADGRAERAYAAQTRRSGLPSGRTAYRRLADYQLELKRLARRHPGLVRPLRLADPSRHGRDVEGIEITRDPERLDDGKPVFLLAGVHHSREWPAGEVALEWAYDLLRAYRRSARTRRLVAATRTIIVPVVNPDGFNVSREAGRTPVGVPVRSATDFSMRRKNCRGASAARGCFAVGANVGVDPNRNYGGFWGGAGASVNPLDDAYRGPGPFSEPETRNLRALLSTRQVTNLLSMHTFAGLVLRPPGLAAAGFAPDEPLYAALGGRLAAEDGDVSQYGFELYDTSGATEDWSYWSTGGLAYTIELGVPGFHPSFERGVVDAYLGRRTAGGGTRAAFRAMLDATAAATGHATLTGRAPAGARLTVRRSFRTVTSPVWRNDGGTDIGAPIAFADHLRSSLLARGGAFSWALNPSTRPFVAGRYSRAATAPAAAAGAARQPARHPGRGPHGRARRRERAVHHRRAAGGRQRVGHGAHPLAEPRGGLGPRGARRAGPRDRRLAGDEQRRRGGAPLPTAARALHRGDRQLRRRRRGRRLGRRGDLRGAGGGDRRASRSAGRSPAGVRTAPARRRSP